jgi:glutathione S-transferase
MKLIIGNKVYSSWSLRGWLACKQSGLHSRKLTVPLYGEDWEQRKRNSDDFAPSSGKVPILWDGDAVVWDSLAIIEYLADKVGATGLAQGRRCARHGALDGRGNALAAIMALRRECPMNTRKKFENITVSAETRADAVRILQNWAEARSRFGQQGPYLFGTFSAADIMLAPVVTRFVTYGFTLPGFAQSYVDAMMAHPWMEEWYGAADQETWMIQRIEDAAT